MSTETYCVVLNGIHAKSGGGLTYLKKILPILAERQDLKIHLFIHETQFADFYPIHENINVHIFDFSTAYGNSIIWEQLHLPMICRSMAADVVFSPANYGPLLARNHVALFRNAVSVIRLIKRVRPAVYWALLSIATHLTLFTSTRVIAVSNYAARVLTVGTPKFLQKKLITIYHGVSHDDDPKDMVTPSDNLILAVSDIYIQKNYLNLIRAISILDESHPTLHLMVAGREIDKNYAKEAYQLVEQLGLQDKVTFLGSLTPKEVNRLYKKCRVFVFPSFVETFGNPLIEAMSFGAPVACSNTSAMPEIANDGAVYFNPHDPKEIAGVIAQLHSSEELRNEVSAKGLERAKAFDWRTCANKTADILFEVASAKSSAPATRR